MQAAAYARYSTEHQTSSSIEYQMRKISEYCDKNGIEIVRKYADEACTGTNLNRPAFTQLCQDARLHCFQAVVIYDITRGSRDISDWFSFRKDMALLGIQVISVEDNIGDIMNPSSFLQEFISVGLGQHHVLVSRQKSMDSIATKAKTGVFLGGVPNFGYNIVNGQYVIDPSGAAVVKKIFALYAAGKSYEQDIIIPVKGDSMEPEISDGDKLCVKLCDDIEVGEIGVFILNGNGYVKKRRDGYWESVNPEYDDIYVSKTDTYKFVGRVIGKAELPE